MLNGSSCNVISGQFYNNKILVFFWGGGGGDGVRIHACAVAVAHETHTELRKID
jgi:hypothetical protein